MSPTTAAASSAFSISFIIRVPLTWPDYGFYSSGMFPFVTYPVVGDDDDMAVLRSPSKVGCYLAVTWFPVARAGLSMEVIRIIRPRTSGNKT